MNTAPVAPHAALPLSPSARVPRDREPGPWHRRVAGLHVLKLCGSAYQMGRQHGELLRDAVPVGPLPYYRHYLERLLGRTAWGHIAPVVWPLVGRLVGRRVVEGFPDFAMDAIRGLADGAQLDLPEVLEGCSMPDTLLWVASRLMQLKRVGPAMHHRVALGLGCTSAIAWGDATVDGKLLHARNIDYHGVGCWPSTAAVIFHEPDEGMRYVSVAAAGVIMGGITAMNEAGLTLTVHQHMFTDATALGGVPIGCVGDLVMRQASTIEEAEAILGAHRPIGCWTYLIADGRRRRLLCWEENPRRRASLQVPSEPGHFGYANIYLDRQLGDTEQNLYGAYWRHNAGRYRRINALLAEHAGAIAPDTMASFLADGGEDDCRISTAIGMLMTVGSVVFRPEDGVLWVAAGEAPVSRRHFVPFDLGAERHAPEQGELNGGIDRDPDARDAFEQYRRAYLAYLDEQDTPTARKHIRRACERAPDQPLYHCLDGLLAIKLGDPHAGVEAFSRALALGHTHPERLAAFHLWRGRAHDLEGEREAGLRDYRAAIGQHSDPPVRSAALRGLRRRYRSARGRGVDIDFVYADVPAP